MHVHPVLPGKSRVEIERPNGELFAAAAHIFQALRSAVDNFGHKHLPNHRDAR